VIDVVCPLAGAVRVPLDGVDAKAEPNASAGNKIASRNNLGQFILPPWTLLWDGRGYYIVCRDEEDAFSGWIEDQLKAQKAMQKC
jgi:hypothetical protein